MMTWEYIAGFFDGEGSITSHGKNYRITIPQTNLEVLKAIKNFCGYGTVFEIKKRKSHWKDAWVFYIARQDDVQSFLERLRPLLVVKKASTERALEVLKVDNRTRKLKTAIQNRKKQQAIALRKHGMTYRKIGEFVNLDWSYIRRVAISNK